MEQYPLAMGTIIRDLRKSKSLTQDALAQAAGVSVQAVSKWETGQSLPDVTLLPSIADFFGTTVDALFGRTAEKQPDAEEKPASPFPDDGKLRVVQYLGGRMLSAEECAGEREIRLCLDAPEMQEAPERTLKIDIIGSARIAGPVNGSVHAGGDVVAGAPVNGCAYAGRDISCKGSINGSASAQGNITCGGKIAGLDTEPIGRELGHIGVKIGSMLGGLFGGRHAPGASNARMNAFFSGQLPDDDILRVIQMQGRRILSAEESADQRVIRLAVDHVDGPLNVEVYGSADVRGDVGGSATAGDGMTCGNVGGNATAGDALTCRNVGGNATAGDGIKCGSVSGNVKGGGSVHVTGGVDGSVSAGGSVTCGSIRGDVRAGSVRCASAKEKPDNTAEYRSAPDVSSFPEDVLTVVQVMNGRILSSEESREERPIHLALEDAENITLHVHGSLSTEDAISGNVHADGDICCGNIEGGDAHAGGNISCGNIEGGDVTAGADVSCGNVEGGDVTAGADVSCGNVEGDVAAGCSVSCGDVGGDATIQGDRPDAVLQCSAIEGSLTAKNACVTCGDVGGDATIEGNDATILTCGDIDGCLTMKGASVQCGTISGDASIEGNDAGSFTCSGDIGGSVYHQ